MIVKCVECGGKVSSEATACPHCGAPVKLSVGKRAPRRDYDDPDESAPYSPPGHHFDFAVFLLGVLKTCFLILAILVVLSSLLFFTLRSDLCGIRTALRKIAESDSGTGSHVDKSSTRVMFKHYLGSVLNAVEGTPAKPEQSAPEPQKTGTDIKPSPHRDNDPEVFQRIERKPIDLPPPPPQE